MTVVPAAHRHPHAEGYGAAWFALLGAPAAWTLYELCSYAITAHACYPMDHLIDTSSTGGAWTGSLIITVIALIIALVALGTATRVWGQTKRRTDDVPRGDPERRDRKSTRLNSSHVESSYAVFCLKKKKHY